MVKNEVVTPPIELEKGENYVANEGDIVFTERHSVADVIRWLLEDGVEPRLIRKIVRNEQ